MRIVTLMLVSFSLWILGGCCSERYDTNNVGVGVSGIVNSYGEIDLSKDLDASKLPDLIKEAYVDGAKKKLKGEDLQRFVVRQLSERIREISTIDLNGDGVTDPVLVIPEGDDEQMTFSIRVPDPAEVPKYPELSNASEWQDIATNKAIEVVALTAMPQVDAGQVKGLDFESRPNPHFYSNSSYYRASHTSDLLRYMIIRDMFFRPMWFGPSYYGWYGGYYSPYSVRSVYNSRTTKLSRYSSGQSNFGRMSTRSGTIPSRSKSSEMLSKKSFSSSQSVRKNLGGKGFGRSNTNFAGGSSKGFGRTSSGKSSRGWFSSSSSSGGFRWGK